MRWKEILKLTQVIRVKICCMLKTRTTDAQKVSIQLEEGAAQMHATS